MHQENQHTIKQDVTISGIGLHTGVPSTITIKPDQAGNGIHFVRVDLPNKPKIKADVDNVVDTSRGTTLGIGEARVGTVEHLLSALVGLGIDNVLIEIDNIEVPIMDGSAYPFFELLEQAGIQEQDAKRIYVTIDSTIEYTDKENNVEIVATPSTSYRLTSVIDFETEALGAQHAGLKNIASFKDEIAHARTFCFLHELEYLYNSNLIKGGDVNNALVVVDKKLTDEKIALLRKMFNKPDLDVVENGILNNVKLRYNNEPARHKLLDMVGDLALVGFPIKANIVGYRPGHKSNIAFAKKIKEFIKKNKSMLGVPVYDPNVPPIYDINYISKLLPHRYPFLLVDKVIELSDTHIVGTKNVTLNEPFFQGHFPDNPVFPGVLQLEALAQTGGIMILNSQGGPEKKFDTYFLKIDNAKFKQKVLPGDTMIMKMELMRPIRRGICEMRGTAYVGNKLVCEADLMAFIEPQENRS